MNTLIARWEAKGGKQFLALERFPSGGYGYRGNGCGGTLPDQPNDAAAIQYMEEHAVRVLKSDFSSTRRVK